MRHWRGWLLLVALAFFILMNRHSDSTPTAAAHPSPETLLPETILPEAPLPKVMPPATPLPEAPLPEAPLPEDTVLHATENRAANSRPQTVLEKPLESVVR